MLGAQPASNLGNLVLLSHVSNVYMGAAKLDALGVLMQFLESHEYCRSIEDTKSGLVMKHV